MEIFKEIVRLKEEKRVFCLATIVKASGSTPRKEGTRMIVFGDGTSIGTIGGGLLEREVIKDSKKVLKERAPLLKEYRLNQKGGLMACGGRVKIFLEPFYPLPRVFIFGAGHVGRAVLELCSFCSLEGIVVDFHNKDLMSEDTDKKGRFIQILNLDDLGSKVHMDSSDFVIVATGSHEEDLKCVRYALKKEFEYIGLLGSSKKFSQVSKRLLDEGFTRGQIEKIRCPVGLSIGANGPNEIAISIFAQIIEEIRLKRALTR